MKTKAEIRKEILNIRNNMDEKEARRKSQIIIDRLKNTEEYKNSANIMVYMDFKNEVNTKIFIQEALREGKSIVIPYTDIENVKIIPVKILSLSDLVPCRFGYLEPALENTDKPYDIKLLDLIVVPGVVFDKRKNRVGFGKGYYDRLLINKKPGAKAIALAYEFQVTEEVPEEEHDIKMDKLITEERIYE